MRHVHSFLWWLESSWGARISCQSWHVQSSPTGGTTVFPSAAAVSRVCSPSHNRVIWVNFFAKGFSISIPVRRMHSSIWEQFCSSQNLPTKVPPDALGSSHACSFSRRCFSCISVLILFSHYQWAFGKMLLSPLLCVYISLNLCFMRCITASDRMQLRANANAMLIWAPLFSQPGGEMSFFNGQWCLWVIKWC